MKTLNMKLTMTQYFKDKKDSMIMGWLLMTITGFGVFFLAAVPVVVMFGGFSNKSTSIGDGLASIGFTYVVGIIMYAVLMAYFLTDWFM